MAQEIEIKFAVEDRQRVLDRLTLVGAVQLYPETFEDNIVLDRRGELKTRGSLLRLRKFGRYVIATYKGPASFNGAIRSREEIQTGMESFERGITLFDALGFKPVFRYQKFREVWQVKDVEVVLDRTPIGEFLEIEGPMETIRTVAGDLDFSIEKAIRLSYADLYRQQRRVRADLPEHMVFDPQDLPSA
ncbi:MAG TPA: class IV adenylate cyclase [Thermoanaerobaculia bacterium]|nr:class IV adenylate cyclase [Thermoanaerobaculia bacterium]